MKLITLEGYDDSIKFKGQSVMYNQPDKLDTFLGEFEDEFGLGAFKKIKKAAKKAAPKVVKKIVPKPIQSVIKKVVPKPIQSAIKKTANLAYNPVAQVKMIKSVAKKAAPIVKKAMKTAKIVAPIAAMSLGLPPIVTANALKAVSDLASGEGLTLDTLKNVAEEFGIPADKLQVASELIKANTPEEREKIVTTISSDNSETGKLAEDMKNRMNETEKNIEDKVSEKVINTPQFLTQNSIAMKLFNEGRIR